MENNLFEKLSKINVNNKVEKKEGLSYLSWTYAIEEMSKNCPDFDYDIEPYTYDEKLGYMVYTKVTANGKTKRMWLPVMDSKNKAMKDHPYKYKTKYGDKDVEAATMFDINKAYMRCLVKNIGMFGLGLYIYAGEDYPTTTEEKAIDDSEDISLTDLFKKLYSEVEISNILEHYNKKSVDEMDLEILVKYVNGRKNKNDNNK